MICLVMSQWSKSQAVSPEETDLATELIIKLIEAQKNIDSIYTHHPALLYWSISSNKINAKIRREILECWIQNTNPDCEILIDFATKHLSGRSVLISILENGEGPVVESSFSILKSLIINTEIEDLTREIWFMIPTILSKYLADPVKISNADYMIELATLKTPGNPDMAKAARTAGCLSEIMVKSDLISLVPCLKLAFQLLDCGENVEDHRVASVYFLSPGFLQKIVKGITLKSPDVAVLCMKTVAILWKLSQNSDDVSIPTDMTKIRLNIKNLLQILSKGDCTMVHSVLELFAELLKSEFRSGVFGIRFPYLKHFKILYGHLQNIIVKELPDTKILSWKCLNLILTLKSPSADRIIKKLIFNPWTHEIIRFTLEKPFDSPELKSFLTTWIELNSPSQIFYFPERHIGETYFSGSVKLIAKAFKDGILSPDKLLCKKLLQSNVNLPSELREELDKMTRD